MAASWPTSRKSFTTKTNNVDDVDAAHMNAVQDEIEAMQTSMGLGKISDIVQIVHTSDGAVATGSGTFPTDDTIPQSSEGNQVMSLAITPKSATHKLLIIVIANFVESTNTGNCACTALFKDSDADALAAVQNPADNGNGYGTINHSLIHKMDAPGTSAYTYKTRCGVDAGPITFNGVASARKLGGVMASSMTIIEYKES